MTFEEYRKSEAWNEAKRAAERRRTRRNLIGVLLLVLDLLLLFADVATEFIPESWYEGNALLRGVICALSVAALAFMVALWAFSKKFEGSGYITPEFFEAQKLLAKEYGWKSFCLGGAFDLTVQFDFTDGVFGGSGEKVSALKLIGVNDEYTISVGEWSDRYTDAFLMGFLQIGIVSYLFESSERGEGVNVAQVKYCADGEPNAAGNFKKRDAVFYVKNGEFTAKGKRIYRKIQKLEQDTKIRRGK